MWRLKARRGLLVEAIEIAVLMVLAGCNVISGRSCANMQKAHAGKIVSKRHSNGIRFIFRSGSEARLWACTIQSPFWLEPWGTKGGERELENTVEAQ